MIKLEFPESGLLLRCSSQSLEDLLVFKECFEMMFTEVINNTNVYINFHTNCYVGEDLFIFEAVLTKSDDEIPFGSSNNEGENL